MHWNKQTYPPYVQMRRPRLSRYPRPCWIHGDTKLSSSSRIAQQVGGDPHISACPWQAYPGALSACAIERASVSGPRLARRRGQGGSASGQAARVPATDGAAWPRECLSTAHAGPNTMGSARADRNRPQAGGMGAPVAGDSGKKTRCRGRSAAATATVPEGWVLMLRQKHAAMPRLPGCPADGVGSAVAGTAPAGSERPEDDSGRRPAIEDQTRLQPAARAIVQGQFRIHCQT